jgi:hypothetical protein
VPVLQTPLQRASDDTIFVVFSTRPTDDVDRRFGPIVSSQGRGFVTDVSFQLHLRSNEVGAMM